LYYTTYLLVKLKDFGNDWIIMGELPKKMKKSFWGGEKWGGFSKWSCCNGQPAQVKYSDFS
jgi:hypothetical protein